MKRSLKDVIKRVQEVRKQLAITQEERVKTELKFQEMQKEKYAYLQRC